MKIVIAPDSFKGSLSSLAVTKAVKQGFEEVFPNAEILSIPLADGGEGTVKSVIENCGGNILTTAVTDPLGERILADYGVTSDGKSAIIEMAAASGLMLIPEIKRNPMNTTTFGTGDLIKSALDKGFRNIIIGLGGSATTDGGAGAVQALGTKLLDKNGADIKLGGRYLSDLDRIDISGIDKRISECHFTLACDVNNPLYGKSGAAYVFAEQKGASKEGIQILDNHLKHFSEKIKLFLDKDVSEIPGAGAAGGLGAGLCAFMDAEVKSGTNFLLEMINFREKIKDADLVITGEGSLDSQTKFGKVLSGVSEVCKEIEVPVIAICGTIKRGADEKGFDRVYSLVKGEISEEFAVKNAEELLIEKSKQIAMDYLSLSHKLSAKICV